MRYLAAMEIHVRETIAAQTACAKALHLRAGHVKAVMAMDVRSNLAFV